MSDPAPETQENEQPATSLQTRLIDHVKQNKVDCALTATRFLTIFFAIGYLIPIFG